MRPLALLIGRNGSGKSNLIEGVELLAELAHGRPLYEISDLGRGSGSTFEVRGGLPGCIKYGTAGAKFSLGFQTNWKQQNFIYTIAICFDGLDGSVNISEEKLVCDDGIIFSAKTGKREDILDVEYDDLKVGVIKSSTHLPSDRSVLSRYASFSNIDFSNHKHRSIFDLVLSLGGRLNIAFVFDLIPKQMRNYERIGQILLARDGSNLSSVLYGLSQGDKDHRKALNRILERLKQLPEEPFGDFEFVKTQLNDVLLALKCTDGSLADARLLSDGTLRALAILTALETVPEHSRIIIEEMDNGIHPSRVKMLVDAIWDCGKRRNLNVLATTHNPATLNCLSDEQLEAVVLCHYDHEAETSRLTPLLDLPRVDVLLERGLLGDLVTRQILDQHLAPNFDEEQKQKAKTWLESLT